VNDIYRWLHIFTIRKPLHKEKPLKALRLAVAALHMFEVKALRLAVAALHMFEGNEDITDVINSKYFS